MNRKYIDKRVVAFILDFVFVAIILSFVVNIDFLNPLRYDYMDASKNSAEVYNDAYSEYLESDASIKSTEVFINKVAPAVVKTEKNSIFAYIWYLVLSFLYFVVFTYYTGGQTLGKKILGLKVVHKDGSKATIKDLALRFTFYGWSFMYGMHIQIILNLLLMLMPLNSSNYFTIYSGITFLAFIYEIALIITFYIQKEHRSIHDLISKTKVIDLKN